MMLRFVTNAFEKFFEVILWINLIGCVIFGCALGWGMDDDGSLGYAFLGIILGFLVGMITNIIGGGMIALFVRLCSEISYLKECVEHGADVSLNGRKIKVEITKYEPIKPQKEDFDDLDDL